jgi:hypothetical protein
MANRNPFKVDPESDFVESDPLAELTRIMGFDPRRDTAPARDEDLGIDLEKELMSDFEASADNGGAAGHAAGLLDAEEPAGQAGEGDLGSAEQAEDLEDFDATFDEVFAAKLTGDEEIGASAREEPLGTPAQDYPDFTTAEIEDALADELEGMVEEAVAAEASYTTAEIEDALADESEGTVEEAVAAEASYTTAEIEDALADELEGTVEEAVAAEASYTTAEIEDAPADKLEGTVEEAVAAESSYTAAEIEDALADELEGTVEEAVAAEASYTTAEIEDVLADELEASVEEAVAAEASYDLPPHSDVTAEIPTVAEFATPAEDEESADRAAGAVEADAADVDSDSSGHLSVVDDGTHAGSPSTGILPTVTANGPSLEEELNALLGTTAPTAEDMTASSSGALADEIDLVPWDDQEESVVHASGHDVFAGGYQQTADVEDRHQARDHLGVAYEAPADIGDRLETPEHVDTSHSAFLQPEAGQAPQDQVAYADAEQTPAAGAAAEVRQDVPGFGEPADPLDLQAKPQAAGSVGIENDFDFDFDFEFDEVGASAVAPDAGDERAEGETAFGRDHVGAAGALAVETAAQSNVDLPATDDLVFDEDEFEAALADEFAGDYSGADARTQEQAQADETAPAPPAGALDADPFAALSTMGLEPAAADSRPAAPAAGGDQAAQDDGLEIRQGSAPAMPEIETVEVAEETVALADDLDIPDVPFEQDVSRPVLYDDRDADFSQPFDDAAAASASYSDERSVDGNFDGDFDHIFENGNWDEHASHVGAAAAAVGGVASAHYAESHGGREPSRANDVANHDDASGEYQLYDEHGLDYDPAADADLAIPHSAGATGARPSAKRGFVVAAVVAGVAIAGSIGVFAYSFGGADDMPPAIVKAEQGPVKIKPENPGGVVVPNQDSKVYERVAGGAVDNPSQEKLISGTEEPVEIRATETKPLVTKPTGDAEATIKTEPVEDLPGIDLALKEVPSEPSGSVPSAKAEDRVDPSQDTEPAAGNQEIAAVAPRKVRTMIVRPDGTLVPREDPESAERASPVAAAPEASVLEMPQEATGPTLASAATQLAAVKNEADTNVAVEGATQADGDATGPTGAEAAAAVETNQAEPVPPAQVALAPSRPSEQPVDIVGEVSARDQIAAATPEASGTAAAGWSMQIASQPTPEGAQATYEDLARRYGAVLDGRGVNIVKADIAGKGTFWRVRVPVDTRNDGIQLCTRYKAAGGSCFVAQ